MTEEAMMYLGTLELQRRTFCIDLIDEAGERRRFTIPREVAAYMKEQEDRIHQLSRELTKNGIRIPESPSQGGNEEKASGA